MADKAASNVRETSSDGWKTVVEPFPETYPFDDEGDALIGLYESSKEVEQDDMNAPGEKRMATVYTIADARDGKKWGVWSSHNIDAAFEKIPEGTQVRIEYQGKVPIDGGRRTVKQFVVQTKNQQ